MDGYIYIIYEREFRISEWPLYKIGRTRDPIARMNGYSKDSIMVYSQMCTDHIIAEKNLINIFKTKFIRHLKFGNEYFEGDLAEMQSVINQYITNYHKIDGKLLTIKNDGLSNTMDNYCKNKKEHSEQYIFQDNIDKNIRVTKKIINILLANLCDKNVITEQCKKSIGLALSDDNILIEQAIEKGTKIEISIENYTRCNNIEPIIEVKEIESIIEVKEENIEPIIEVNQENIHSIIQFINNPRQTYKNLKNEIFQKNLEEYKQDELIQEYIKLQEYNQLLVKKNIEQLKLTTVRPKNIPINIEIEKFNNRLTYFTREILKFTHEILWKKLEKEKQDELIQKHIKLHEYNQSIIQKFINQVKINV